MVVNFSGEEIVLPMASVLGAAEAVPASVVAAINDSEPSVSKHRKQIRQVYSVGAETKFTEYLRGALSHLNPQEKEVMESVLLKYRTVFHDAEDRHFKGIDLVEHRIITGDARPIRNAPCRVPFALRGEMENQVRDMLHKGVTEPSSSPWSAPAIVVPKKSPDGTPKYRFCVDFRALKSVTQFDTYPLSVFEETVSTLHGSRYFSVVDCFSGFWQIKIAEECKMKTAFSVPSGHYNSASHLASPIRQPVFRG
jgi:hypothetical protein